MDYQSFKAAVIAEAEALGITEYELYYQSGSETSIGVFRNEINEFSSSEGGGVCFRCIVGGKMGYASTQALNESEAKAVVARAADNAANLETEEQVFLCEGGKTYQELASKPYALPTTEELIETALATQKKIYAAHRDLTNGLSPSAVCEKYGFGDYSSFYRLYRKTFHCAPNKKS